MMELKFLFFLFCGLLHCHVNAVKILGLVPSPSKSHTILVQAFLKKLAEKGHEVTMVTPYPLQKPVPNFRNIQIRDLKKDVVGLSEISINDYYFGLNKNLLERVQVFYDFGYNQSRLAIEDNEMRKLIHSNEKFDLVISTIFFNEVFLSLADHFKAQLIGFGTFGATEWTNDLVGNPAPYACVPHLFTGYTEHMTFSERFINTVESITNELWFNYIHLPNQEKLRQKYLPHTKPLSETLKDVSLVLLNSHPSLTGPRALVPNMIEVGGFHVLAPNPLPNDLQKMLEESTEGAIYFSMGTNIMSKDLPESQRQALLEVFGKLKKTVFWKWEDSNLPGKPKNVKISNWYPQSDLLAHPNVKLFITHGGLLSTTEAVARGVPMIGIPIFADQSWNMAKAESLGYGLKIDFHNLTAESLTWAINEILHNPKYTENVKQRSKVFNDRLVHPLDETVYWIEYVLRNKGTAHLQSARKYLNLFQYLLMDIIAAVAIILTSIILTIRFVLKNVFSLFWHSTKPTKNTNKKSQ